MSAVAREEVAAMLLDLAARVSADGRLAGAREERERLAAVFRARAEADRKAGDLRSAVVWEAAARVCGEEAK